MTSPATAYVSNRDRHLGLAGAFAARGVTLSRARGVVFLAGVASGVAAELQRSQWWAAVAAVCAAAFIALVVVHRRTTARERWQRLLAQVHALGLLRLSRRWSGLPPSPAPTEDLRNHAYADDLDVFGAPALTQLLSPAALPGGRVLVSRWFLDPDPPAVVTARQDSVRLLATELDWRTSLTALGMQGNRVSDADIAAFVAWTESTPTLRGRRLMLWTARLLPPLTLVLALAHGFGAVAGPLWLLPLLGGGVLSIVQAGRIHAVFRRAFAREGVLRTYPSLLAHLATVPAHTPALRALRDRLTGDGGTAAEELRRLTRLMELSELRYSGMLHAPVQFVTLWDFHVLDRLEAWQVRAGRNARDWLDAAAEIDATASLAAVAHDHPSWVFPRIDAQLDRVQATSLGHPMLHPDRCVRNDVEVGPRGTLLLVTGSNMSGKSTLLRALGSNVLLAQAGAPVCADAMSIPPLTPFTSGRIRDSLTEGVSLFLAELQRMRAVVEAARATGDRTLFYLLDEMLHGTNTAERRIAARTVIEHLLEQRAIGVVTTHDLTLAEEATIARQAVLAHFTETVSRGEDGVHIDFDYTLRPGLATSTNALVLLEIVGLQR